MGFWGSDKRVFEDVPDEQLNWNQKKFKQWRSRDPIHTKSGLVYEDDGRRIIDARLNASLGLNNIDDLLEMKAPRFFYTIERIWQDEYDLAKYIVENLPNNNQYQQLQGKYDELQKKCEEQKAMIEKLMAQNEKLQNQIIDKVSSQSASFSR